MKSRKVQIAVLSFVLAWGGGRAAAGAATRPARAERPPSGVVALWLGWMWNALVPAWDSSRGTMDPDGTVTPIVPMIPLPADPTLSGDGATRSRGTMDPDGGLVSP